jgi:transcriptional regulator with XRE-family HTH domain
MAEDLLSDDPDFIAELKTHLWNRRLVRSLAILRAQADLSQQELAEKLGCSQSRISKLESGVDADVRFADFHAYLSATGFDVRIMFVPAGGRLVDLVEAHALMIESLVKQLVEIAGNDESIAKGAARFIDEAVQNLVRVAEIAKESLPDSTAKPRQPIEFDHPRLNGSSGRQ